MISRSAIQISQVLIAICCFPWPYHSQIISRSLLLSDSSNNLFLISLSLGINTLVIAAQVILSLSISPFFYLQNRLTNSMIAFVQFRSAFFLLSLGFTSTLFSSDIQQSREREKHFWKALQKLRNHLFAINIQASCSVLYQILFLFSFLSLNGQRTCKVCQQTNPRTQQIIGVPKNILSTSRTKSSSDYFGHKLFEWKIFNLSSTVTNFEFHFPSFIFPFNFSIQHFLK